MPDYVAMFRMTGATTPTKTQFSAATVSEAIAKMLSSVNQTSTMNVDEFEILEVMEKGQYRIAATKNKKETKVIQGNTCSQVSSNVSKPVVPTDEGIYTPYTKLEA